MLLKKLAYLLSTYNPDRYDEDISSTYNSDYYEEDISLTDLDYDVATTILTFKIIKTTTKPKITRYVTRNYERTPIYDDLSVKTKKLKDYHKAICIEKFLEEELVNLSDLNDEIRIEITNYLTQFLTNKFAPSWYQKLIDIKNVEDNINNLNNQIDTQQNKLACAKDEFRTAKTNLDVAKREPVVPNSIPYLVFTIILIPVLIGIIMLGCYTSKTQAAINQEAINQCEINVKNLADQVLTLNTECERITSANEKKISEYQDKLDQIKRTIYERKINVHNDGFLNLRQEIKFSHKENIIGVYIIWNKTKNKYYVGQSKDVNNRIYQGHFCSSGPKKFCFFQDWSNNDEFLVKIIPCTTKDELDRLEKMYIEQYDAFNSGYNSTGGNK